MNNTPFLIPLDQLPPVTCWTISYHVILWLCEGNEQLTWSTVKLMPSNTSLSLSYRSERDVILLIYHLLTCVQEAVKLLTTILGAPISLGNLPLTNSAVGIITGGHNPIIASNGSLPVSWSITTTPMSSGSNSSFCIYSDFCYTDLSSCHLKITSILLTDTNNSESDTRESTKNCTQ